MKYSLLSLIVAGILIFSGCSDHADTSEKENKADTVRSEEVDKEKNGTNNKDKKWKADASTKHGIQKMQARIKNFDAAKELTHYKVLSEELNADMNTIFQKCSMKGEGHEKLHEYLLPLKKDIQALGKYEEKDSAEVKVREIRKYLKEFDERFK